MPRAVLYPEWRDENGQRKYPFADNATMTNGTDIIDPAVVIDAHLYPIGGTDQQFLSGIDITADLVTFYVSDQNRELCSGSVDPRSGVGTIELKDSYGRPSGILLLDTDQLLFLTSWPLGEHRFEDDDTGFAAAVVHPMPETAVRGLLVDGILYTGDVWLVGGEGVVFTSPSPGVIHVDVPGDPYYTHRRCENVMGTYKAAQLFLKSVSGVLPNAVGNIGIFPGISITGDTAMRAVPIDGGLRFELVGVRGGEATYVRD